MKDILQNEIDSIDIKIISSSISLNGQLGRDTKVTLPGVSGLE